MRYHQERHVTPIEFPPLSEAELALTWQWCECVGPFEQGIKAPEIRRVIEAVTRVRLAAIKRPAETDLKRAAGNDTDDLNV